MSRSRARYAAPVVLAAGFLLGGLSAARADVCLKTDLGLTCVGPGGGRTSVVAQGGCCVHVDSTGPVQLGRTGLVGNGITGLRADAIVYVNGYETGRTTASPDSVTQTLEAGGQTVRIRWHAGCCVDVRADGPVTLAKTGVYGDDEALTVFLDEERAYTCAMGPSGVPSRCKAPIVPQTVASTL